VIRCAEAFVAVETEGRWTRGATVVDFDGRLGAPPNAAVALELDAGRFWDLLLDALGRFGAPGEAAAPASARPDAAGG
jgi:purine nucleosidase/pyrimidine-specific ribonucleoside hydrolase